MEQGACNIYEKRKWDLSQDPRFLLSIGSGNTHWRDPGTAPFSVTLQPLSRRKRVASLLTEVWGSGAPALILPGMEKFLFMKGCWRPYPWNMVPATSSGWGIFLLTWYISQGSVGCELKRKSSQRPKTEKKMECGSYFRLSPEYIGLIWKQILRWRDVYK